MTHRQERLIQVFQRVDQQLPGTGLAKHKKMASSPFVFLRGACSVFYDDLASAVLTLPEQCQSWPITAVLGDCHVSNFGLFSEEGSHGNRIIFAPNDFDDCSYGNAGWDLMRFLVSLILCADHCQGVIHGRYPNAEAIDNDKVIDDDQVTRALNDFLNAYQKCCNDLATQHCDYDKVIKSVEEDHILYKFFKKAAERARAGKYFEEKSRLAKAIDKALVPFTFTHRPERYEHLNGAEYLVVKQAFAPYVDDTIVDIVIRLGAGTGSVNMERYYLLVGPEQHSQDDLSLFHLVEVKKQRPAAALHEFAHLSPINQLNPAHLTAVCQRRMQRDADFILDEVFWRGAHWLVRSRHHAKVGIDPEDITCGKRAVKGGFADYASVCGTVLALAHGRADRRSQRFEKAVASQLKSLQPDLIRSAYDYADIVKQDWQWLSALENNAL